VLLTANEATRLRNLSLCITFPSQALKRDSILFARILGTKYVSLFDIFFDKFPWIFQIKKTDILVDI